MISEKINHVYDLGTQKFHLNLCPLSAKPQRSLSEVSIPFDSWAHGDWEKTNARRYPSHLYISELESKPAILNCCFLASVHFSSVAQSCPTLCDPMDCSTPGLLVHHQLPEFTQNHVHWVSDAIQPPHPLSFQACYLLNRRGKSMEQKLICVWLISFSSIFCWAR